MPGADRDAGRLQGKTVAFTGRLASMTRARAAELVREFGGKWVSRVSRCTALLVVGQEGLPLRKDGRLSRKLQMARRLGRVCPIEVVTEGELLGRLGLESSTSFRRLSTSQLSQVLKLPGERIRAWVQLGLLRPAETTHGVHYFDFRQASWARTLCDFVTAGVAPERIRKSLQQLRRWLPEVDEPMAQLSVLEADGNLLVRLEQGLLCEPSGQQLFPFDDEAAVRTVQVQPAAQTAAQWFEAGCAHEDAGRLQQAAHAYRQALAAGGPDKETAFNLANVLYALGRREQAAERFRQVTEMDGAFVAAWNNLGNVLAELKEWDEAEQAFEKVLELDPENGDAHYNLADLLDETNRQDQAREHFRIYLDQDSASPWAGHARRRLRRAII